MSDLLESGDTRFNIPLIGGDVVSVPRAGIIYVVGAVVRVLELCIAEADLNLHGLRAASCAAARQEALCEHARDRRPPQGPEADAPAVAAL